MTRPALTWAALWLAVASAVAAGIIAGFLLLSALAPGAVRAATFGATRTAGPSASGHASIPAVHQPRTLSPVTLAPETASPAHPAARQPSAATLAASPVPPGGVAGVASWWASFGPGIYAALPGYIAGTRVTIRVWSGSLHVDATVITSCGCYVGTPDERIVDLSPGILRALGLDPARGLYPVRVERLP